MSRFTEILVSSICALFPLVFLLSIWDQIPQTIPMHYDMSGQIDRYGSKMVLAYFTVIPPIILIGLLFFPKIMKRKIYFLITLSTILIISGTIFALLFTLTNSEINGDKSPYILIGLMVIPMGLVMRYTNRNSLIGIRIPCTLNDPVVWEETHKFASVALMLSGLLILMSSTIVSTFFLKFSTPLIVVTSLVLSLKKASDSHDKHSN